MEGSTDENVREGVGVGKLSGIITLNKVLLTGTTSTGYDITGLITSTLSLEIGIGRVLY